MYLVQDRSLDLLTSSPAFYHCATDTHTHFTNTCELITLCILSSLLISFPFSLFTVHYYTSTLYIWIFAVINIPVILFLSLLSLYPHPQKCRTILSHFQRCFGGPGDFVKADVCNIRPVYFEVEDQGVYCVHKIYCLF